MPDIEEVCVASTVLRLSKGLIARHASSTFIGAAIREKTTVTISNARVEREEPYNIIRK